MIYVLLSIILLLALYVRLDFLLSVEHHIPHDTKHYDVMVKQLLENGIYAYKSTQPNAQVAPGFPLFLAAIYSIVDYNVVDPFPIVRYIQVSLSMITLLFIFLITKKISRSEVGLVAAFISTIYPPFVWANGAILTEVLATFFLMIYIYFQIHLMTLIPTPHVTLHKTQGPTKNNSAHKALSLNHIESPQTKRKWANSPLFVSIWAGISLGLTVIVRPEFLPIFLPIFLFLWLWKRDPDMWKYFLGTVSGIVLVLLPWWIRNMITLQEFILLATQANPFKAGTYPNKEYNLEFVDKTGKSQSEIAWERLRIGFTEQTWVFMKWYTIGKLDYLYSRMYFGAGHHPIYTLIPWRNLFHSLLVWAGLISIGLTMIKWRQVLTTLVLILITITSIRLLFVPEYRYNFSMMPLLIILNCVVGSQTMVWMIRGIKRRFLL